MGKTTVEVKKDSPGFIVNRLMMAQYIEAIRLLEEGVATMEDIDNAVRLGLNHPMGAFELHDYAGLDVGYFVAEYFHEEFKDIRWTPPQALKALIRAGRLGKKTGAGWYDYKKIMTFFTLSERSRECVRECYSYLKRKRIMQLLL
jgi:3-hydroxybutyryl-CoA dehydrogenase